MELQKYSLDLDWGGDLQDFNITEREVAAMRATGRIELPPSFIKQIKPLPKTKFGKELVCEGYNITNTWPNNVVLLTGKQVMYCVDFYEEEDPVNKGFSKFFLSGMCHPRFSHVIMNNISNL